MKHLVSQVGIFISISVALQSQPAFAEYAVIGMHEATVCTGWGIKVCSTETIDAVAKGDTVYTLKTLYTDVDEYSNGRCTMILGSWDALNSGSFVKRDLMA